MKELIKFTIIVFAFISSQVNAQIGINTPAPLTAAHIAVSDPDDPQSDEGVIIPRVTALNTTDLKTVGLLVFLDTENPATPEIERGFYWWNGVDWIPFFSMNKLTKDRTITYVSCLDAFREGNITSNISTNTRTLQFDASSLIANDTDNFEINANNDLVVKKAGTYHLFTSISLNYTATGAARDAFEGKILVNGSEPTPNLRTSYGFPSNGSDFTSNNNFTIGGYVTLNENDVIRIQVNRYYRDAGTVVVRPNGLASNLMLRYMGDF